MQAVLERCSVIHRFFSLRCAKTSRIRKRECPPQTTDRVKARPLRPLKHFRSVSATTLLDRSKFLCVVCVCVCVSPSSFCLMLVPYTRMYVLVFRGFVGARVYDLRLRSYTRTRSCTSKRRHDQRSITHSKKHLKIIQKAFEKWSDHLRSPCTNCVCKCFKY